MFGDMGAHTLANEWVNRCQWFYNKYFVLGEPAAYVYTAADRARYTPLPSFANLTATLHAQALVRARALANLDSS